MLVDQVREHRNTRFEFQVWQARDRWVEEGFAVEVRTRIRDLSGERARGRSVEETIFKRKLDFALMATLPHDFAWLISTLYRRSAKCRWQRA